MSSRTSVRARVFDILRDREFTNTLLRAMTAQLPKHCRGHRREQLLQRLFDAMVRRVSEDVTTHPRREVMFQILKDGTQLSRTEFYGFLDFLHSCLVSHFKGELGEILAWPLLQDFVEHMVSTGLAPPGVEIVPGHAIEEKRTGS